MSGKRREKDQVYIQVLCILILIRESVRPLAKRQIDQGNYEEDIYAEQHHLSYFNENPIHHKYQQRRASKLEPRRRVTLTKAVTFLAGTHTGHDQ